VGLKDGTLIVCEGGYKAKDFFHLEGIRATNIKNLCDKEGELGRNGFDYGRGIEIKEKEILFIVDAPWGS
jgi:hypothetical protein